MKIPLWENNIPYYSEEYGQAPELEPHIIEGAKACLLIIPGGGYHFVAYEHEGVEIAEEFGKRGISSFILRYRVAPYAHPVQLTDAQRALRYIRYMSKDYGYDANKIAVIGFSAGGHLTSMLATLFDDGLTEGDEIDRISSRPDAAILSYAVTNLSDYPHQGTAINLLGADASYELRSRYSSEKNVREDTPPMFIWHTEYDTVVSVEHALGMASALMKKKIPTELHIFPMGDHGLGTSVAIPYNAKWVDCAEKFMRKFLSF